MKKVLLILFIINTCFLSAYDFSLSGEKKYETDKGSYDNIELKMRHKSEVMILLIDFVLTSDSTNKFGESDYFADHSPVIKEGSITYSINNYLRIKGGKIISKDEVDSPYSLFFSSIDKSSTGVEINYEDKNFIYKTTWMELNKNSAVGYLDRGMNYKYYGFKLGKNWKIGYQDSVVYTKRSFDNDYFLNPLPVYFIQGINNGADAPWKKDTNDNSLMGLNLEFENQNEYFYTQVLVDDFNANQILHKDRPQNPDKIALSLGYKKDTGMGKAGVYLAAATKYTFEPYGDSSINTMYGYTHYPDTEYKGRAIGYKDNYIGYLNGENNVALKIDYDNEFNKIKTYSFLEFVLSGAKSPANPWHEYINWNEGGDGAKFFDKGDIEKSVKIGINFVMKNGNNDIFGGFEFGRVFNKLELCDFNGQNLNTVNSIKMFKPTSEIENTASISLGYKINF